MPLYVGSVALVLSFAVTVKLIGSPTLAFTLFVPIAKAVVVADCTGGGVTIIFVVVAVKLPLARSVDVIVYVPAAVNIIPFVNVYVPLFPTVYA